MLKLRITTHTNGTYNVEVGLRAVIAWERKFRTKASQLAEGTGLEDLAFLGYEGSKDAGIVVPVVFDDFIADLVNVDVVEDEPVNPSAPAPSPTH